MTEESKAAPLFNDLLEFFTGDEWGPEQLENQPVLQMEFEGDNGKWTCLAFAHDDRERVVFTSLLPVTVTEAKLPEAAEFICRANFGMEIGNFEMDYTEGAVQFRTSIDIEGGELTPKMIQNLAYVNVWVTDQYLPGLVMVLEGDATPAEAIESVENKAEESE